MARATSLDRLSVAAPALMWVFVSDESNASQWHSIFYLTAVALFIVSFGRLHDGCRRPIAGERHFLLLRDRRGGAVHVRGGRDWRGRRRVVETGGTRFAKKRLGAARRFPTLADRQTSASSRIAKLLVFTRLKASVRCINKLFALRVARCALAPLAQNTRAAEARGWRRVGLRGIVCARAYQLSEFKAIKELAGRVFWRSSVQTALEYFC